MKLFPKYEEINKLVKNANEGGQLNNDLEANEYFNPILQILKQSGYELHSFEDGIIKFMKKDDKAIPGHQRISDEYIKISPGTSSPDSQNYVLYSGENPSDLNIQSSFHVEIDEKSAKISLFSHPNRGKETNTKIRIEILKIVIQEIRKTIGDKLTKVTLPEDSEIVEELAAALKEEKLNLIDQKIEEHWLSGEELILTFE